MRSVLLNSLVLITVVTIAAQVIYALKGQIFEFDGRLATREILFAIICFQVVMQFSFGFSVYAVNQTELQNHSFDGAYAYFIQLQELAPGNRVVDYQTLDLLAGMPESVESVLLAGNDYISSSGEYFRFPINDGRLLMRKSSVYFTRHLQEFALSLLMSLIISVLLMAEITYLAIKLINNRKALNPDPAGYLRQIAFLFYFAGFLGASFIPIMARNFAESNTGADFIAGLPYSVEALFNCVAIVLTPKFFKKSGWKPLYLTGVAIFAAGLVSSALSPNVFAFIASRALVGVGYGFCWMTLRNIATLGPTDHRPANFAGLSSGIYAGMMCGVAFGAVLADMAGFRVVLVISAVMVLISALFPVMFKNAAKDAAVSKGEPIKLKARDIAVFAVFMSFIVIPTGVSDAFRGFLLPLYVNDLGLPTAYVGRVSLVYNLCIVYISSTVLLKFVWRYIKKPVLINVLHMLIISAALFVGAYAGGFMAVLIMGALLGSADGFGFSAQNSYILDTRLSVKIGAVRMLTLLSLFKKFTAMFAPLVFGLFIVNGFQGLGAMAAVFVACALFAAVFIFFITKKEVA